MKIDRSIAKLKLTFLLNLYNSEHN